jgi:hypothetical protein
VTPVKTVLPAGQLRATEVITITDSGKQPMTVTATPATVSQAASGCGVGRSSGWMTLSERTIHLAPGQQKAVKAVIRVPKSATGTHDLTAVLTAHAVEADGHGGNVTVTGAVGTQFVVTATGVTHAPSCAPPKHYHHPVAASAGAGGSSPGGLLILLAVAVAVTGAATAGFIRELRRRRATRRRAAHAS